MHISVFHQGPSVWKCFRKQLGSKNANWCQGGEPATTAPKTSASTSEHKPTQAHTQKYKLVKQFQNQAQTQARTSTSEHKPTQPHTQKHKHGGKLVQQLQNQAQTQAQASINKQTNLKTSVYKHIKNMASSKNKDTKTQIMIKTHKAGK